MFGEIFKSIVEEVTDVVVEVVKAPITVIKKIEETFDE